MADQSNGSNVGKVIEIKGVVIDAVFTGGNLPEINSALRVSVPERDGRPAIDLIAEVQQHLGDDRVRAVAMDSTDGIPRGVDVVDTGAPITRPRRRAAHWAGSSTCSASRSTASTRRSRPTSGGRSTATRPISRI